MARFFFMISRRRDVMERVFTAIFEKVGKFYIGYVEELPGVNTQGKTLDKVRENIREAIELVLSANRELAEIKLASKNES
jgi:predicted RNase H-like HicB family nuclease